MKKTLILQCPGMVCSPPVVSKCLGEAHRRLDIIYIIYITLHYITLQYITLILFFFHTVGNLAASGYAGGGVMPPHDRSAAPHWQPTNMLICWFHVRS